MYQYNSNKGECNSQTYIGYTELTDFLEKLLTKSVLKIWLLSINFEKFTSINLWTDQSQHFKRSTVIGPFISLTDNNQIFRNDFDFAFIMHLCKISSQIIECKIYAPYDFLEMKSITTYSMVGVSRNF